MKAQLQYKSNIYNSRRVTVVKTSNKDIYNEINESTSKYVSDLKKIHDKYRRPCNINKITNSFEDRKQSVSKLNQVMKDICIAEIECIKTMINIIQNDSKEDEKKNEESSEIKDTQENISNLDSKEDDDFFNGKASESVIV